MDGWASLTMVDLTRYFAAEKNAALLLIVLGLATIMLVFDLFAEHRARGYVEWLAEQMR